MELVNPLVQQYVEKYTSPEDDLIKDVAAFLQLTDQNDTLAGIQSKLKKGDLNNVMPEIITTLGKNSDEADGKLKKATLGIFNLLGKDHPLSKEFRPRLDMTLAK